MTNEVTSSTKLRVFGLHAGRCAFPGCGVPVVLQLGDALDVTAQIGEIAHIVSKADDGPRSDPSMSMSERNHPNNLLLLCRNHHGIIDDRDSMKLYSTKELLEIRSNHISYVSSRLDGSPTDNEEMHLREILLEFESIIEPVQLFADVDNLMSHIPALESERLFNLADLGRWYSQRNVPESLHVGKLLRNFVVVLSDLHSEFASKAEIGTILTRTIQFHKEKWFEQSMYHKLAKEYQNHVRLIHDLVLEVCRAYNALSDSVRSDYLPDYFRGCEALSVEARLSESIDSHIVVPRYKEEEVSSANIYGGLNEFKDRQRYARAQHYGDIEDPH